MHQPVCIDAAVDAFKHEKEALIHLIEWYRDKYHKTDFGHTDMIASIKKAKSVAQIEPYWQAVDGWLD